MWGSSFYEGPGFIRVMAIKACVCVEYGKKLMQQWRGPFVCC